MTKNTNPPPVAIAEAGGCPPLLYWLIPAGVALIGWLPHLWQQLIPPPEGASYFGYTHLPMDFGAYEAFMRQATENASILLSNPFTTEPQSPRFILLFHWLLGVLCGLTHVPAHTMIEASRVTLVFSFFWTLWWFLKSIFDNPRDRISAALLIGFSGGIDQWITNLAPGGLGQNETYHRFVEETQIGYGWNFLGSSLNPLWILGITISLVIFRYALVDGGMDRWRERAIAGGTFFLLYWIHPYSAIGVAAVVGSRPLVDWFANRQLDLRFLLNAAAAFGLPAIAIVAIALWQVSDPVYRVSSSGLLRHDGVSWFWYPLTFGAVGLMAIVGARTWFEQKHRALISIAAWIIGIAFLHSTPIIIGSHFIYLLPIPVCILAAEPTRMFLNRSRKHALVLGIAVFAAPVFILIGQLTQAERVWIDRDILKIVDTLKGLPAGNVMSQTQTGNLIAARTHHRVWLGHLFLTPEYKQRATEFAEMTSNPIHFSGLLTAVNKRDVRYVVVSTRNAPPLTEALGDHIEGVIPHGRWTLLIFRATGTP